MTVERSLPFVLPPSPFVTNFAANLPTRESLLVLDAGACEGRNSLHLAKLGHKVVALTNDRKEALSGAFTAREMASAMAGDVQFVVGDVRRLMFKRSFDVVLSNEVLHLMTKYQAYDALKAMADITKPGGIHAVSGYVVNPREASETNKRQCFHPNELLDFYKDAGWQVLEYSEDLFSAQEFGGRQIVQSLARIVATR